MNQKKKFPWGHVIERFEYDFDGKTLDVVKYHPWKVDGCNIRTGDPETGSVSFHCSALSESWGSLDALLISWIARRRLGINEHALVGGICRALKIEP